LRRQDLRIAILGAGNLGDGLAAAAVRAGHDVAISASKLESAESSASLAFLNITLNAANGWVWQTGRKLVGPTASAS
jgi:predicted dinucleotide-binding enzyme